MNRILSVFGIALGLMALGSEAHALQKYQSRTKGSQASYSAYSSTECGYETVSVYVFEEQTSGNQTAYDSVYIDYSSYDFCSGSYASGFGYLDGAAFDMQRLQSASVDGDGTMELVSCNYGGGGGGEGGMGGGGMSGGGGMGGSPSDGGVYEDPCTYGSVPFSLSVDWTGTGDTYRERYTQTSVTPNARYRYTSNGQSRQASVNALIEIDGATIELTDESGGLSIVSSGTFEIIR